MLRNIGIIAQAHGDGGALDGNIGGGGHDVGGGGHVPGVVVVGVVLRPLAGVGLNADNCRFAHHVSGVVGVGRRTRISALVGVGEVEFEVAVVVSAPSPVEMVEAVAVVAVADKGMSALRVSASAVEHGAAGTQFVIDEIVPPFDGIGFPDDVLPGVGVVVEIIGHAACQRGVIGPRHAKSIVHLGGIAAVEHEVGNGGLGLREGVGRSVFFLHLVPLEGGGGLVGQGAEVVVRLISRHGLGGFYRPAVIVHKLGSGSGHAARQAVEPVDGRCRGVVNISSGRGLALVPGCLDEGGNGGMLGNVARGQRAVARLVDGQGGNLLGLG